MKMDHRAGREQSSDLSKHHQELAIEMSSTYRQRPIGSEGFRYSLDAIESKINEKILPLLYTWMDGLSPKKTLFATFNKTQIPEPYRKVIDFLYTQGVIDRITVEGERFNDTPSFHRFALLGAYEQAVTDGKTDIKCYGFGFSKNRDEALSKVIGEFLERYPLTIYRKRDLYRSSLRALKEKSAVDIHLLAQFSDEQKMRQPAFRWNDDSTFFWEKITRISSGKNHYIPAQLVYWNYKSDNGEPYLRERNTNGCGGFFTKEGAILSGLYELIQRDGFFIYWLNALTPPKVRPESVPDPMFQQILEESKRYGFTVHCLNTTLDLSIPSFVVLIEDTYGQAGPYLALGGGCQADPAKALTRALVEAWTLYFWVRKYPTYTRPETISAFETPGIGQRERIHLLAERELKIKYEFLMNGAAKNLEDFKFDYPPAFSSETEELKHAVEIVERHGNGYEVYAFLKEHYLLSRLGYHTARVVVPALIPLYLNEENAPLGAERIAGVPRKLGIPGPRKLNPWPHPFP
ncbi:hypothetical protein C4552_01060 [Candidatus Parcubacteria bacterium]|nr:MAG: hypothetical protein C4552_01060 [Candidatus Parcubacteria bacterium]